MAYSNPINKIGFRSMNNELHAIMNMFVFILENIIRVLIIIYIIHNIFIHFRLDEIIISIIVYIYDQFTAFTVTSDWFDP